ncbi:hypothetical protein HDK77DRAFT_423616 [Phyllosticta capitalensis]
MAVALPDDAAAAVIMAAPSIMAPYPASPEAFASATPITASFGQTLSTCPSNLPQDDFHTPSSFFDDHESAPARKIRPDCPRAGPSARHSQFAASSPNPNPALPAREHKCNDARMWAEERHHAEPKQGATRAMARIEIVVYVVCTLRPQLAWWPESDVRHRDNDGAKGRIQIRTLLLFLRADQASAEDGGLVVDPGNCHVG